MTTATTDPRLRRAPPYIGWVPGTVNVLKSAPKVPGASGGLDATGSAATTGRSNAASGADWATLSGRG